MFLPTTKKEMKALKWDYLDVILITGDAYIDSPHIGIAVIGKVLVASGFKVGVIAQPDWNSDKDITRLGEPRLFWGVSAGSVDSMVANRTASNKRRNQDDYTPGEINNARPDRASIMYTGLIRRFFKNTVPIVLGGIEASLRRIAHYDYWSNKIRRSILFNSKADILTYGMAEKAITELAKVLSEGGEYRNIKGLCYIAKEPVDNYIELPSFEEVNNNKKKFIEMFNIFYRNINPKFAKGLCQKQDFRYLVQNPPQPYMTTKELDWVYELNYERDAHPEAKSRGKIRALDTIKFSITAHRGCYGECNFCAITVHQGKTIRSRSEQSILNEARRISKMRDFRGIILDVGGPTANMYATGCKTDGCTGKRCMTPKYCKNLNISHARQLSLLKKLRQLPNIKRVFVASGIRYDMVLHDKQYGKKYLRQITKYNVSGQLKLAPEHSEPKVLQLMGKPAIDNLVEFRKRFNSLNEELNKKQFLTYYFIAAHPGCKQQDMQNLNTFIQQELKMNPEQVQVFTPTPSTFSTMMYATGLNPFTGEELFVEYAEGKKLQQKWTIMKKK